jgi:hypothetical protein
VRVVVWVLQAQRVSARQGMCINAVLYCTSKDQPLWSKSRLSQIGLA